MVTRSSVPKLPSALPAWLTPPRIALLAVPLGAAALTSPLVPGFWFIGFGWWTVLGVAATALVLTAAAVRLPPVPAAMAVVGAGALAGGLGRLAGVAVHHAAELSGPPLGEALAREPELVLLFAILGASLGLASAGVVATAVWGGRRRALDAPGQVLAVAGVWLAASGAVAVAAAGLHFRTPLVLPGMMAAVLGVAGAALGAGATRAQSRWLARVAAGNARGWSIEPPVQAVAPFCEPPSLAACAGVTCGDDLVHTAGAANGPYRGAVSRTVVARIDPRLMPEFTTRAWVVAALTGTALAVGVGAVFVRLGLSGTPGNGRITRQPLGRL